MTTRAQKIARLKNRKYRDAFVASQISVGLPFQIRALRERRGWKQSQLAARAGMLQPRISAMESPGETKFNLETLRRLASAFDVALIVKFVPFSELVGWSETFNPDTFVIPSFDAERAELVRASAPVSIPNIAENVPQTLTSFTLAPTSGGYVLGDFGRLANLGQSKERGLYNLIPTAYIPDIGVVVNDSVKIVDRQMFVPETIQKVEQYAK